jgi:hypothetical protein
MVLGASGGRGREGGGEREVGHYFPPRSPATQNSLLPFLRLSLPLKPSLLSKILLHPRSTEGFLDDVERAVNDAINCYKALGKDSRALPAGGATEIELARRIAEYGHKQTGLEQYAIVKVRGGWRQRGEKEGGEDCGLALVTVHCLRASVHQ